MNIEIKISKQRIPYKTAIKFLKKRVELIKAGNERDLLWILEHPLTYTGGIRSDQKDVLDKKIKIIKTNRGGKVTLHNPGQKIVYFALDLNRRKKDIRHLIDIVEKSIIEFLKLYKIKSRADKKEIGIWVKKKKIAAIGIRISKWVAFHGCSININNDLKKYKKILPCGLDNENVTSVLNEKKINIINVDQNLSKIFDLNFKKI